MKKLVVFFVLCFATEFAKAQFRFESETESVNNAGWHQITLPNRLLEKLNEGFIDVRLFSADSKEVPYLLNVSRDEVQLVDVSLQPYNISTKGGDLYFTIKTVPNETVNRATIELDAPSYDCEIMIEGSHDEKGWFELTRDQRIVSIHDNNIQYESNLISWPNSTYTFLRFRLLNAPTNKLLPVNFSSVATKIGEFEKITAEPSVNTKDKQTQFIFQLPQAAYISKTKINFEAGQKFYRNYSLEVALDSTQTEKGWITNYMPVQSGVLASFASDSTDFNSVMAKKIRLIVYNQDNPPIKIKSITTYSPKVSLIALLDTGKYFLRYGNPTLVAPAYDIDHFKNEIPKKPVSILLKDEKQLAIRSESTIVPWFKNKKWLWAVMLLIVTLLGYFTLTMIRKA